MTICGYHPRMGTGLADFGVGLVKAVVEKAGREGRPLDAQLVVERDEIYMLKSYLAEMMPPPGTAMRSRVQAFLGVVQIAAFMMETAIAAGVAEEMAFQEHVDRQSALLAATVEAYENGFEAAPSTSGSFARFSGAFASCFLPNEFRTIEPPIHEGEERRRA